jgi:hypothetical protein
MSCVIAADSLEYGTAVTHDMGKDMDLGVIPADKATVEPDLFGGR